MKKFAAALLTAATIVSASADVGLAQDNYPTRPVKLLIGFPVGGIDHVEQCRDVGLPFGAATGRPLDLTFEQPMEAHFSPMVVIVMV